MSFVILPNEILERIARYLDTASLAAFSQVSTRCKGAIHRLVTSLHCVEFNPDVEDLIRCYGPNIRALDMSNCQATSGQLEALILRCPNLENLNVVNTRLTIRSVVSLMQVLCRLEAIHFGLPTSGFDLNQCEFPNNEHIKRLYIEVPPIDAYYIYAIDLINTCLNLEWLHLFVIDSLLPIDFNSRHLVRRARSGMLLTEQWQTLHTVIVSSEARDSSQRLLILIPRLFELCPTVSMPSILVSAIAEFKSLVFERGRCNLVLTFRQMEANEQVEPEAVDVRALHHIPKSVAVLLDVDALRRSIPEPKWGLPQGLAVSFSPALQPFPSHCLNKLLTRHLTELNLTKCHWRFPETTWWQLIVAVPALQALAISACSLPAISDGPNSRQKGSSSSGPAAGASVAGSSTFRSAGTARDPDVKRPRVAPSAGAGVGECPVIEALSEIPLKQLYIRGDQCRSCMQHQHRTRRLGKVSELVRLESLTLKCVFLAGPLLESLWSPTVKTLKIISVGSKSNCEYLPGFKRFTERCRALQHLKLEHESLLLGSVLLWEGLAQASRLSQLCLSSSSSERVDLHVISKYLTPIRANLRHLHVHARASNYRQLEKSLKSLFLKETSFEPAGGGGGGDDDVAQPDTSSSSGSSRSSSSVRARAQRPSCAVLVTLPTRECFSYGPSGDVRYPMPGRSVCYSGNFIGHPKPEGWEFH